MLRNRFAISRGDNERLWKVVFRDRGELFELKNEKLRLIEPAVRLENMGPNSLGNHTKLMSLVMAAIGPFAASNLYRLSAQDGQISCARRRRLLDQQRTKLGTGAERLGRE